MPFQVFAQTKTITGNVKGTDGDPLSGVTVLEKGTSNGAATDASGNFSITVANDNASLIISSLGYQSQTIALAGRSEISVTLQGAAATQLEQVVVVGYGTQKRRDLTGSIASVQGADLAKQPVVTATQALQGKVAGVQIISSGQPNSLPTVRI
ncbi:MAG: carboxypeptidase-like regulatory domain-containing protein, partial [Ginsengibacter sp.]